MNECGNGEEWGEGETGGSEPSRETVATENPGQREPASNQRNGWMRPVKEETTGWRLLADLESEVGLGIH